MAAPENSRGSSAGSCALAWTRRRIRGVQKAGICRLAGQLTEVCVDIAWRPRPAREPIGAVHFSACRATTCVRVCIR